MPVRFGDRHPNLIFVPLSFGQDTSKAKTAAAGFCIRYLLPVHSNRGDVVQFVGDNCQFNHRVLHPRGYLMATAKKATADAATAPKRTPNAAFMKAMTLSPALAAVIGDAPLPRTEVTKKVWEYIKQHNLQDSANRRNINADDKLAAIFKKPQVSMFEMTKLINEHLS
jgi:upstream activation factor subunit UAF30